MPSGVYPGNKGRVAWNKGLSGIYKASEETKAKLREKRKGRKPGLGRKVSDEERKKRREIALSLGIKPPNLKGFKHSEEARKNMSAAQRSNGYMQYARGPLAPNWKGGIASKNHVARTSKAFIEWRDAVFTRDNWTCQQCGTRGVHLHPHHIKEFAKYPSLRFDINNGLTLCKQCHLGLHGLLPKPFTNGLLTAQTPAT